MSVPTPFRVHFGNELLEYRLATLDDPVPTGLQLLEAAEVAPAVEHVILQLIPNGLLESLRPDETVDLRSAGIEKFLIFRTDRTFRFVLDDRSFEWGSERILGVVLKKLAGVDPATHVVVQDRPGSQDKVIANDEFANLQSAGTERFHTETVYNIIVNGEQAVWRFPKISYDEIVKLAFPNGPFGENIRYNVSWTKPDGQEGSLRPGKHVGVVEGMSFDVRNTDKS